MYFIIEILGKQYKIFKNIIIKIDYLNINLNSLILINKIILFSSNKYFFINNFFLNKIIINARVVRHFKLKKITTLKFKKRKGLKKKYNFKKKYTEIVFENFNFKYFLNIFKVNGSKKIGRFF
ncbi:50S ribosomal protein L21 [Candidatus Nasuia deltocephalinicola]|uniref:50S ribosomal protein L21 n=1 Tax=Candidatus Nasuia deltocephalincola TaxID=1160784 RepID=UPI00216B148B|nr:50S ribosomal protein L21 [Candidatus Nasuia deltocephalinicola]